MNIRDSLKCSSREQKGHSLSTTYKKTIFLAEKSDVKLITSDFYLSSSESFVCCPFIVFSFICCSFICLSISSTTCF